MAAQAAQAQVHAAQAHAAQAHAQAQMPTEQAFRLQVSEAFCFR